MSIKNLSIDRLINQSFIINQSTTINQSIRHNQSIITHPSIHSFINPSISINHNQSIIVCNQLYVIGHNNGKWDIMNVSTKQNRQEIKNNIPITVLSAVNKVFETILSTQITNHYDSTLFPRMTAYRKRNSCETTLLSLVETRGLR